MRSLSLGFGFVAVALSLTAISIAACSANSASDPLSKGSAGADGGIDTGTGGVIDAGGDSYDGTCALHCSDDHKAVLSCGQEVAKSCGEDELCADKDCYPACEAAKLLRTSVGCDYYPTQMDNFGPDTAGACFAVFVANTWSTPAHVTLSHKGQSLDAASVGYLPIGTGKDLTYQQIKASDGIPSGKVAIFFLAGPDAPEATCPEGTNVAVKSASVQLNGTGIGNSFHLETDVPVVAYQILPYGGGAGAVTGASLLLPTSVWDKNYVAMNAYKSAAKNSQGRPSLNIIAMEDNTEVTILPNVDITGQGAIGSATANSPLKIKLSAGQFAQITQPKELTGSPIQSTKPIGLLAGHECMSVPENSTFCDHGEQQIPPVRALGSEYVGLSHRARSKIAESPRYRIVGAVNGTQLVFDPKPAGAPDTINLGDVSEFVSAEPFIVKSQDDSHPFVLVAYMSGQSTVQEGYGDPDFVRMVPPRQYLNNYAFFTDPTYPETNLVIVREKGPDGFEDVKLDCAGNLQNWQAVGSDGRFEYTRIDLSSHNFKAQGKCDNGSHKITSPRPFGLWIWGWGTPETTLSTASASYAYPAGENVIQLNDIEVPATPK